MADPVASLGISVVAAYLSKDGIEKLLGPTAEYLGNGLRDFTQRRIEAIGQVLSSAYKKIGDKAESPGEVPPKVLGAVLNEASYTNDMLAVEYFGGILASSRSGNSRDDRGARQINIIDMLSTYQLRAHYLIYTTVRKLFLDKNIPVNMDGRPKMQIFVPFEDFLDGMDLNEQELDGGAQILNHIFFGLHADGLIEGMWQYGVKDSIVKVFPGAKTGGIVLQPSSLGVELYLAAFG